MLKGKTFWIYFRLLAVLLAIATSIYYCIQSNADKCFEVSVLVLLVVGIVIEVASMLIRLHFLQAAAAVCFGVAFGLMLFYALPTFSDIWNGVVFIGGNAEAYFVYLGMIFAVFLLADIPCFCKEEKAD